jgi:uncharacterized protein (DUF433 family)
MMVSYKLEIVCYNLPMKYKDIITIDPKKRSGKPTIRGMRITVYDVLKMMASGMGEKQILSDYPELTKIDLKAVLEYASDRESALSIAKDEITTGSKHFSQISK